MANAGQTVVANSQGKRGFLIPVRWEVCDFVEVQANSLEEAHEWLMHHEDEVPLGTAPNYIDGSYEVEPNVDVCRLYLDQARTYVDV